MNDSAMDFFDLMGREGPCFHCGIDYTPLWRSGPPEKPVLCNACGSRWKTKGSLEGYIPKHAIKDVQSNNLSSMFNSTSSIPGHELKEPQFGSGNDQSSPVLGEGTNYGSSSASMTTFSEKYNQMQDIDGAVQPPLWDPNDVSRKKRSTLEQHVSSPTERLHQQLYNALQDSEFTKQSDVDEDDAEDVLIFERINHYIPENEIGLGCMLLKLPPSPPKDSKPESPSMLKSTAPPKESKPKSSFGLKITTSPS